MKQGKLKGSPPFLKGDKISTLLDVAKNKGHDEIHTNNFSPGSPHVIPSVGGPVLWRAKWDDRGIGNCDLHECVRIFLLGQDRLVLQWRAAGFPRAVTETLRSDGASRG